jgi:glycosyltransferase involved in cell wall biosynthesis
MAAGIPVIVTDYSGHTDFCDDSTAFMVKATLVETRSHFEVPGARWAEPSTESLRGHMRYVYENRDGSEVRGRVARARKRVGELTWQNSAEAALAFIRSTLES